MDGHCSHGIHKLAVAFSSIYTSQYGYFDVGTLFKKNHIHSARRLTYNWDSTDTVITIELTVLYFSVYVLKIPHCGGFSTVHSLFASLLGPNIRLRILFSNTLSLHSSPNVRDHVSQPYSTTGNIIVLYILIPPSDKPTVFRIWCSN